MPESPLISVLIPSYNHEKYIQGTIKSIINQTYKNIELIIIDDGSKDSSWQKIQEMKDECERRFNNIHFETKENEGTCKTLNKLLELSQGKYIYFIASDDLAKPDAITKETEFLEKNPDYALCVGDDEIIDSESNVCYWDKDRNLIKSKEDAAYLTFGDFLQEFKHIDFNSDDFGTYRTLYTENYIPNGYLIRKEIFKKTGYYTTKAPLEDYYLLLQISKYAKMKYIDEILFSYRWHESNAIKNVAKVKSYTKQTFDYEEQILENINEKEVFEDVVKIKKHGVCYKKQGIPLIFEIDSYVKLNKKIKYIKLFGIKIGKLIKNRF